MLDADVSRYLLELYGDAREMAPDEFMEHALERARPLLGFDSALWGIGRMTPEPVAHALVLNRQSEEMMVSYADHAATDRLATVAAYQAGRTIDHRSIPAFDQTSLYHEHCLPHDIAHTLCTVSSGLGGGGLQSALSLYRARRDRPFSEGRRALTEALFPHLKEAVELNWLLRLQDAALESEVGAMALCDRFGYLLRASGPFHEHLAAEWPHWHGERLPANLRGRLGGGEAEWWGERLHVAIRPMGGLFLLRTRPLTVLDRLPPRQRRVAELLASGASYKAVAAELGISPSTVTNQANAIYARLDVASKTELAHLLAR